MPVLTSPGREGTETRHLQVHDAISIIGQPRRSYAPDRLRIIFPPTKGAQCERSWLRNRLVTTVGKSLIAAEQVGIFIGDLLLTLLSKVAALAVCYCLVAVLHSQVAVASPQDSRFVFDTASIHPDDPHGIGGMTSISFQSDRYQASHVDLRTLLKEAYGIDDSQILHAPSLLDSRSFTITATIDQAVSEAFSHLSIDDQQAAHRQMLQQLLADRFQLVVRQETNELPIYLLVTARSGPHLHEASDSSYEHGAQWGDGAPMGPHVVSWDFRGGHVHMVGQSASLNQLVERWAQKITPQLGRKVINNTGLTANYDFDLSFRMPWPPNGTLFPDAGIGLQNTADPDETSPSSDDLFAALQKQLGLQLKSSVGPVSVITIERLELPSDN